jgi:hypothetical protein
VHNTLDFRPFATSQITRKRPLYKGRGKGAPGQNAAKFFGYPYRGAWERASGTAGKKKRLNFRTSRVDVRLNFRRSIHLDMQFAGGSAELFPLPKRPLTQTPSGHTFGYNYRRQNMSMHKIEKNATLKPDVLALLAEQAQAENTTVDDLLDEAARRLIETRRDIDGLRSLVAENRAQAIKAGWTERSVGSVVKKHRQEKRVR